MTRLVYASKKGGKPLRMGMNLVKRIARFQDQREAAITWLYAHGYALEAGGYRPGVGFTEEKAT